MPYKNWTFQLQSNEIPVGIGDDNRLVSTLVWNIEVFNSYGIVYTSDDDFNLKSDAKVEMFRLQDRWLYGRLDIERDLKFDHYVYGSQACFDNIDEV